MAGRRTISIRAASYARLFAYAQEHRQSCADVVEDIIAKLTGVKPDVRRTTVRVPEGAPLNVTPPAEIDDKPRAVSRFSAIPSARDCDKPRPLAIPEHTDDASRSRLAPTPAAVALARRRGGTVAF